MNFILQTENNEITLDMCFQMEQARKYWCWRNPEDTFVVLHCDIWHIGMAEYVIQDYSNRRYGDKHFLKFNPEAWCPVGTVEFVEKYLRKYFGDEVADNAMRPLNVPECFLENKMNTGRKIVNLLLSNTSDEHTSTDNENSPKYFIKDNVRVKNPLNGIKTVEDSCFDGLKDFQISEIIKDGHNSSEWRAFIHNGKIVDIKHYAGDPFVFPNMDTVINSYMHQLGDTLKEGTLDVYVDEIDEETYVMECHKFFSCGLYGFSQLDILPLMFWRTFLNLIKK